MEISHPPLFRAAISLLLQPAKWSLNTSQPGWLESICSHRAWGEAFLTGFTILLLPPHSSSRLILCQILSVNPTKVSTHEDWACGSVIECLPGVHNARTTKKETPMASHVPWNLPVISVLVKLRQGDHEFKICLSYRETDTEQDPEKAVRAFNDKGSPKLHFFFFR